VDNIKETHGEIFSWKFKKATKKLPESQYKNTILTIMARNLECAEKEGQGSNAVSDCMELLICDGLEKWHLRLFYDLNYLLQQKLLLLKFLQKYNGYENISTLFERQVKNLSLLRKVALHKMPLDFDLFKCIANDEYKLSKEVPIIGINN
jgi:hypothetical protein